MTTTRLTIITLSILLGHFSLLEAKYKLFKEANHTEFIERIEFYSGDLCQNVTDGEVVKSVDTVSDCLVLYDEANCGGQKLRLYSPNFAYNNLEDTDFGTTVLSVGRCKISVKLYDEENYKGYKEKVELIGSPDCVSIRSRWATNPIKSLKLKRGCLYVHDGENCDGNKLQLKSGRRSRRNFSQWEFRTKIQSISPCTDYETYWEDQISLSPPGSEEEGPIFGQFLEGMNASVIKVGSVPPHDHFCELTRRCSKNRNFNCDAMKNENRCYCHTSGRVTCDSSQFKRLNSGNWEKREYPAYPLAGEYQQEYGLIHLTTVDYDSSFVEYCQLVKLCMKNDEAKCEDKDRLQSGGGDRDRYSACYIKSHEVGFDLTRVTSAGIIARKPQVVEEDDDFK